MGGLCLENESMYQSMRRRISVTKSYIGGVRV